MGIHGITFRYSALKPLAERSSGWLALPLICGEARGPESVGDPLAVEDGERRHIGMRAVRSAYYPQPLPAAPRGHTKAPPLVVALSAWFRCVRVRGKLQGWQRPALRL